MKYQRMLVWLAAASLISAVGAVDSRAEEPADTSQPASVSIDQTIPGHIHDRGYPADVIGWKREGYGSTFTHIREGQLGDISHLKDPAYPNLHQPQSSPAEQSLFDDDGEGDREFAPETSRKTEDDKATRASTAIQRQTTVRVEQKSNTVDEPAATDQTDDRSPSVYYSPTRERVTIDEESPAPVPDLPDAATQSGSGASDPRFRDETVPHRSLSPNSSVIVW